MLNRRAAPRFQPAQGTLFRFSAGPDGTPAVGLVWNISSTGLSMLVADPFAPGDRADGELTAETGGPSFPVSIRVIHVCPTKTGDYFIGVRFDRPLQPGELVPFLGHPEPTALREVLASFTGEFDPSAVPFDRSFPRSLIYRTQHILVASEGRKHLPRFLSANMDELRLYHAEKYADALLRVTDHNDAVYFRKGVLRREMSRDMDFDRQRDHAAHTLHNYLLGWYLACHSDTLYGHLRHHFEVRFETDQGYDEGLFFRDFLSVWSFASLLHDVGYLFEGGLQSLDASAVSARAGRGAEYVREFFDCIFWEQLDLGPADLREWIAREVGVFSPVIESGSLGRISDSLRGLGDLRQLWAKAAEGLPGLSESPPVGDAFAVWEASYRHFKQDNMADRLKDLEAAHTSMLREGLPGLGIRVLDHGVAGGMLLLLHSTLYYRLHFGLTPPDDGDPFGKEAYARMEPRLTGVAGYDPDRWWRSVTWGTAAVAFHNVAQSKVWAGFEDENPKRDRRLVVEEDSLTYLGVLVDILQEWDRYTTNRNSVFTGKLPVSSEDVRVWVSGGLVHFDYGDAERADDVRKGLGKALVGWEQLVAIH